MNARRSSAPKRVPVPVQVNIFPTPCLVQIAGAAGALFALDNRGRVWRLLDRPSGLAWEPAPALPTGGSDDGT